MGKKVEACASPTKEKCKDRRRNMYASVRSVPLRGSCTHSHSKQGFATTMVAFRALYDCMAFYSIVVAYISLGEFSHHFNSVLH